MLELSALRQEVFGNLIVVHKEVKVKKTPTRIQQKVPMVLLKDEIHEIFLTDEQDAGPGSTIDRHEAVGLFLVKVPGMIRRGDYAFLNGKKVGRVAGYEVCKVLRNTDDLVHIIIVTPKALSGKDLGLNLGASVVFSPEKGKVTKHPC